MDFNELQNAWNRDIPEKVKLPQHLEKIRTANTPLDKIKRNLKKELIYQVIAVVFISLVPLQPSFPAAMTMPFYLFYSVFVAVCVYYLVKLYFFYKRLTVIDLKTKDSLYETYFDIRLNMEIYKTFSFALSPFIALYFVGLFYYESSGKVDAQISTMSHTVMIGMFAVVTTSILFMGLAADWWVKHFYGKYAKEIKNVLDELKEE